MAFGPEQLLRANFGWGVLIGLGAAAAAPAVLAAAGTVLAPVAKALIKTGLLAYERGRDAMAEAGEALEDLAAEAAAELEEEHPRAAESAEAEPARERARGRRRGARTEPQEAEPETSH